MAHKTECNFESEYWGWNEFKAIFENEIIPIYLKNEEEFDPAGVHGVLHASRTTLFTEFMIRYYHKKFNLFWGLQEVNTLRFAAALHDAGREGNGPDIWENNSAQICYRFLLDKGFSEDDAKLGSDYIIKSATKDTRFIVCDSDVLEIMRPGCGHGGVWGFRSNELIFLSDRDPIIKDSNYLLMIDRIRLMKDAWNLILATETECSDTPSRKSISYLLKLISDGNSLPFLKEFLIK